MSWLTGDRFSVMGGFSSQWTSNEELLCLLFVSLNRPVNKQFSKVCLKS